ncbi:ATP synthase B chain, Subunit I [[Synechococcus] sp. NIES-970]|uniref:F0F1 ATP synthase subunit B n=1 Tax=Picosynechococcus sp. NKBG15041c TaxID=1407650 RepID=UPI0003F8BC85|nr:F0F1 ATP synthase subunit B [Picosynechococcus sp. NKBG15041c]BAW95811.1 ATP synthase B chain, Subunit I [[Synechococcus] sp. NIES-970]
MGIISYLATASEGGFHLNFDILETNIINLAIIIGVLYVYGSKFIGNVLETRKSKIVADLKDAESRAKAAQEALTKAQKDLEQAQAQAVTIREEAKVAAEKTKQEILAKGREEVEKLKASAVKELSTEQTKVITELKRRVAELALAKVEAQLRSNLDESAQAKLVDRSIAQLGGGA